MMDDKFGRDKIVKTVQTFIKNKTIDEIASYNFRKERKNADHIEGIKGFKEYKINYEQKKNFDCDSSELNMSIWCLLLEQGENVEKVLGYKGRKIYFMDKAGLKHTLETDTINSFSTDFNKFFRKLMKRRFGGEWYYLYSQGYGLRNGKLVAGLFSKTPVAINNENRDKWMIQFYEELFNDCVLSEVEMKIFRAYEMFSNWTHTLGNFMIGPVGFNLEKGRRIYKDRLDLFLSTVRDESKYARWKSEFLQYMDVNVLDIYFTGGKFNSWDNAKLKNLREGGELEWIHKMIERIRHRGIILAKRLKAIEKDL